MTASLDFPRRFINKDILKRISYELSFNEEFDEYTSIYQDESNLIEEVINYLENSSDYLEEVDGLITVLDDDLYGEERIIWLENTLKANKIPFDSTQYNGLYVYKYRPNQSTESSRSFVKVPTHPSSEGPFVPLKYILNLIDGISTDNVEQFKETLLKNFEKDLLHTTTLETYLSTSPLNKYSQLDNLRLSFNNPLESFGIY